MNHDPSHRVPAGAQQHARSPRDRRAQIAMPTGERFNGRWTRRQWALASLVATLGMLLAAIVPGFSDATRPAPFAGNNVTQALALPKLPISRKRSEPGDSWRVVTVEPGQTLGAIFEDMGVPTATMYRILEQPGAREVLTRLIDGQANKTMAENLGISPRTIEIHRCNAMRKLNVSTSAEAVRIGLYAGLDQE